jgi:hypothetical protein
VFENSKCHDKVVDEYAVECFGIGCDDVKWIGLAHDEA